MTPYLNPSLPLEQRLDDLMGRMTLEEKILQTDQYFSRDFTSVDKYGHVTHVDMKRLHELLAGHSVGSIQLRGMNGVQSNQVQRYAAQHTRLGIPFLFGEEAVHGLMNRKATAYPQQLGLAATFNPALGHRMGRGIATEARACGIHEVYAPVMDLARDPRFGRTEESYGEDVHLSSVFAREVVRGLQGDSLKNPDCVAAEPKHYVGYGNPVGGLNCAPATMGRHDVFAYCMPVFEAAFVDGGAVNAMCSYNSIDGVPVSMDPEILTDILRGRFGMPGLVRSDMTAVSRLFDWHFVAPTKTQAIQMGLTAGVDIQLYDFSHEEWQQGIAALVSSGEMDEAVLDLACRRVLRVKFMLGLFDNPYIDEARQAQVLCCQAHRDDALQIAREGICLLKNDGALLPLSPDVKTIAVLGPAAAKPSLGNYSPQPPTDRAESVLDGVRKAVSGSTQVLYERGCNFLGDSITPFQPDMLVSESGAPGLTGRYYNNRACTGVPVAVRDDLMILFNWIYAKPHPDVDASGFSVVWTGHVRMPADLDGCIGLGSQDSMRLFIDGALLVDGWGESKRSDQMVDFHFEAGRRYAVRI